MLVLLVGRAVNVALPLTLGGLVDVFEKQYGPGAGTPPAEPRPFWPYLIAYVALRFLQASGGLSALRDVSFRNDIMSRSPRLTAYLVDLMGSCHAILRSRYVYKL